MKACLKTIKETIFNVIAPNIPNTLTFLHVERTGDVCLNMSSPFNWGYSSCSSYLEEDADATLEPARKQ